MPLGFLRDQGRYNVETPVLQRSRLFLTIICCHPLVTLKSHLGLKEQPHILDPVTVLTATVSE